MESGDGTVDVNGYGLQFMSINPATFAADDDATDDQGERTDATLDGTIPTEDEEARADDGGAALHGSLSPRTPRPGAEERATSLFATPP
eukprot:2511902-Pleurochrysis_carterae.AAC.1